MNCLLKYAGLTQREAADYLEMGTGAAACKQLGRLKEKMKRDRELRATIDAISKQLEKERAALKSYLKG